VSLIRQIAIAGIISRIRLPRNRQGDFGRAAPLTHVLRVNPSIGLLQLTGKRRARFPVEIFFNQRVVAVASIHEVACLIPAAPDFDLMIEANFASITFRQIAAEYKRSYFS
jgi:hypothetical protein